MKYLNTKLLGYVLGFMYEVYITIYMVRFYLSGHLPTCIIHL